MKRKLAYIVPILLVLLISFTLSTLQAASTGYPEPDLLVSGASLGKGMGAADPAIIDGRSKAAYHKGHIPGAVNLPGDNLQIWGKGLKSVAELENLLGSAGLSRDKTIVVYDDGAASWGAAGHIFWILEYLGHNKVRILNGGWDKWVAEGRPTDTKTVALPAATFTANVRGAARGTKESILGGMQSKALAVIDARTGEEYMGWQLYGEKRGGHIPGAVNIPYTWLYNKDKTILPYGDLKTLFESRGITTDKAITAYCTVGVRSGFVYFALRLMGYPRVSNYDASVAEWAAAPEATYPMEKAPNHSRLVSASWLKGLMDGKKVPNAPAGRYIVAATASAPKVTSFIPGSIWIKPPEWELRGAVGGVTYGSGNLWPDATLRANIESWGIDKDTAVIVYIDSPGSPDAIAAARLWWALMYAGVSDVRLLDGGIDGWTQSGYPVAAAPAERKPVAGFFGTAKGLTFPLHPEYLATTEEVERVVAGAPNAILADIRSKTEYIGGPNEYASIGIPLTATGRIPGAKWGHWGPTSLIGGDFWNAADGSFRSYVEVAKMWEDYGITPIGANGKPNTVITYCGTGWRSSLAFFYGYLAGWTMKNYDGSFFEWAMTHPKARDHKIENGWPY